MNSGQPSKTEIGLWRTLAPHSRLSEGRNKFSMAHVFPSGRQALSAALRKAGLGRNSRIAIPEWSSHCVISAAGKVATPIPMNEVIYYNIYVDAVLVYEQWGWPFLPEVKAGIFERFKRAIVVIDRVDSAGVADERELCLPQETILIELFSLSKTLGLAGGGLVRINGDYELFNTELEEQCLSNHLWNIRCDQVALKKLFDFHKDKVELLHPDLVQWLNRNDLLKALAKENTQRGENLSIILNSKLSSNWPDWMRTAFTKNGGPGIVPIFKGCSIEKLRSLKADIKKQYKLGTEVYHFNWSGDPLHPEYQKCLAFPIHGQIENLMSFVYEIEGVN